MDALRPIVMAILKNLEHVDERFLKQLVTDKQLYQEADVGVKRQIWLYHQSLFGEELGPLFEQYMAVSCSECALLESGSGSSLSHFALGSIAFRRILIGRQKSRNSVAPIVTMK